jgi:cyclopropane fatty-acyl-phospholipid synthase-like methyltransferase
MLSSPGDFPTDPHVWVRGPAADLFSSYVAAAALAAAHELGLLDQIATAGSAPLRPVHDSGIDRSVLEAIWNALHWAGVIRISDGQTVIPGPGFADAYSARGYFYWMVRGCGEVFTEAPRLALTANRDGAFFHRDMRAVAVGAQLIGEAEAEQLLQAVLAGLAPKRIADLGCGSGQRIIDLASRDPGVSCVGVDISGDAVRLARESAEVLGLSARVTIRQADVCLLDPDPAFDDIDVITCVFMGHDFWPFEHCVAALRRLRAVFPAACRLLLCDVTRSGTRHGPGTPVFTLGFEFVHALMGVYVPTLAEWQRAFAASGWACEAVHELTAPPSGYLFELSEQDQARADARTEEARPCDASS